MNLVDYTDKSDRAYRSRNRAPHEVTVAILHQTGLPIGDSAVPRVRAHALVRPSGEVVQLHPWLTRLLVGSGRWNAAGVSIEIEGSFPGRLDSRGRPVWYLDGKHGRDRLADRPAQVTAALDLLAHLKRELPSLTLLGGHRQEAGSRRGGCPGPDVWSCVAVPALASLGYQPAPTWPGGLDIPPSWGAPTA